MGQRAMRGRHPQDFMEELGFGPLDLVDSFSVSMAGEPETRTGFHPVSPSCIQDTQSGHWRTCP